MPNLLQIYQPADTALGITGDSIVTINPAHVRCVRLYPDGKKIVFVFNEKHLEYVHFPSHNYSEILDMVREAFQQ